MNLSKANYGDNRREEGERGTYVSIHLGSQCNYNCTYCDRDAIREHNGFIKFTYDKIDPLIEFLKSFNRCEFESPMDYIQFYGGEPLMWIGIMDEIMDRVKAEVCPNMKFHIVTNGAYVLKNKWFFEKWNDDLMVSLSYDFGFQVMERLEPTNEKPFNVDKVMELLDETNVQNIEIYYTIVPNRRSMFNLENAVPIIDFFSKHKEKVNKLTLIMARYTNKPTGFVDFLTVDGFSMAEFIVRLKQFLELLYIYKIPAVLDGVTEDLGLPDTENYDYYVVGADGYLYADFVGAEYGVETLRKGEWLNTINPMIDYDPPVMDKCNGCEYFGVCNDRFFYKAWATEQEIDLSPCKEFMKYVIINLNNYIRAMKRKPDLLNHIMEK